MTDLELLVFLMPKIIVATICGLIIGWERKLRHKVAGIRTHILICVGACIFTAIGFILVPEYHTDPTRVIGQIVTGVGFLCAGVIFKDNDKIIGITSSAFIWFIASIGVLIGLGFLWSSILFTIGLLAITVLLEKVEKNLDN